MAAFLEGVLTFGAVWALWHHFCRQDRKGLGLGLPRRQPQRDQPQLTAVCPRCGMLTSMRELQACPQCGARKNDDKLV